MLYYSELNLIFPEIIIFLSGLFLLIYGVFSRNNSAIKVNFLTLFFLFITLFSVFLVDVNTAAFNGSFINTKLTKFIKIIVLIIAIIAVYISKNYLDKNNLDKFEYPVLFIFSLLGMLVMISSNDLIMLYISLELQSLSLYVLVALKRESLKTSEASLKYFILGSIASAIILYGSSMIYSVIGHTNYNLINEFSDFGNENIIFSFGIILILSGIAFKLSAAPFHMWTPDVYEGSPSSVTTILVTLPKLSSLAVLIHLLFNPFINQANVWQSIIIIIAILSMLIGSISALRQDNLKRLFAYSTIANIGYVLIGISCANKEATVASLLYMLIYTFGSLGVFSFIMLLRNEENQLLNVSDLAGFSKLSPLLALALIILLLSMAGIPPFAGFFAKLYIFSAAIEEGLIYLAILGIIFSVVSAYYYLKIIKTMYLEDSNEDFLNNFDKRQSLAVIFISLFMLLFVFYGNNIIYLVSSIYL